MSRIFQQALVNSYINKSGLLAEWQINHDYFSMWIKIIDVLYDQIVKLSKINLTNQTELNKLPLCTSILEILDIIYNGMIGKVNGYPLMRIPNIIPLFVCYSIDNNEILEFPKIKEGKQLFRLKVEHFFCTPNNDTKLKAALRFRG